jgi:5-methylcytosine-specific restriction endonuclease McrA
MAAQHRPKADRDWQDRYDFYKRTIEWQQRRKLVLKRCHGICEACGIRTATEVHHLTYRHVFSEPLFDLVGVCRECHEALTEMDRASRG